ncbi:cadmium resistance transporter [Lactiplantibacillus mudanjiangensis]|uniref:Cadmium resistance protein [Lactobacillus sakei] n=1 Tax=Lactiplantibacillus mudanjiangensis TaxID=1296538 RepID=A0A660E163_9LACO|nr:cadmium resistance transporter [Lactiplantibacillus mudanjiangensis]VDG17858.1 cadmium resistance protein [Lactobacillus sakei] [Lactiplantibacillus mudanjiangensis]VDG23304.1 cadmium resistance protein [Lactobacillus sakei] [Lactiplantibacillus mudanjiangensis]VDG28264.1 cadmium resistance protein [Lactobacillus sakei] [Lactiplantibacillus mudanjiangensis]VDG32444.1 cadmium resistance protein [Lactobacillus sakei] [Lactiplantibacillus mudanjiangensis]
MQAAVLTGITAYISTSIDYLIILMVIFGSVPAKQRWLVYWGDLLGTAVLVAASLIMAFVLGFVPQEWLLGLLGLIPIFMGIQLLVVGEKDDDAVVTTQMQQRRNIILNVAVVTIATCGADNIGIYVPIFTQAKPSALFIILFTFLVMLSVFCYLGYLLIKIPKVADLLERYGRYITAVVYIGLGAYIMLESGTVQHLLTLI